MHPDAASAISALGLAPHPEGGFYRETFRAPLAVDAPQGRRSASTAIYFLLPGGAFSALHRVRSDEVWHHYDGDPLELHTLDDAGRHEKVVLGRDIAGGQRPQHVVAAGVYQAVVARGDRYALGGCTVAPGFDFADFEMPSREALLATFARFPGVREVIARLTRG
jgi:predicted cupin superfamily sugar epimerase